MLDLRCQKDSLNHSRTTLRASVRMARFAAALLVLASCRSTEISDGFIAVSSEVAGPEVAVRTRVQRATVRSLANGQGIPGSNGTLHRTIRGLSVSVRTGELEPHESVDVFWAIFNEPAACTNPNPFTGVPCSPADLFNAATEASLHYVATLTADGRGRLAYSASLERGSDAGCVGEPFPCAGVTRPFRAEVHSAMFVPNGGAGRQAAQFVAEP